MYTEVKIHIQPNSLLTVCYRKYYAFEQYSIFQPDSKTFT